MKSGNDGQPGGGGHVLVRGRRNRGDSDHHGGAWKIAYADFMTAMMAFFLVMWLVNATDEKTVVQVAAYFNPLRLTEKSPSQKGLHDGNLASPQGGGKGAGRESAVSQSDANEPAAKARARRRQEEPAKVEQQLFSAPEEILSQIEARAAADYVAPRTGGKGEIQDPWLPVGAEPGSVAAGTASGSGKRKDAARPEGSVSAMATGPAAADATLPQLSGSNSQANPGTGGVATPQEMAAVLARDIDELVARVRGRHPRLEVRPTREGVLVSLMDEKGFGMFASASAEPRPEVVLLLREIGALLARRTGAVVISGHTDGRPYRTSAYDNWRLSTSRAHAVRFMLARGGLDERRIERVEGHADRSPRNPDDGDAAENRRIDILLRLSS